MIIALLFWAGSIAFVIAVGWLLCGKIEASGVKRWGATRRLFGYEK